MVSAVPAERTLAAPGEGRLRVNVIQDEAAFDELREQWNEVADRMQPSSPMLEWEWCRRWWRYFHGANRLQILTFARRGRIVGIAQFMERRVGLGNMAIRLLKPIGWEDYGNQGMTEHLELLFPPDHRSELMTELAQWIKANRITSVWLPGIDSDETLPAWLASRVVERGHIVPFHHRSLPSDWLAFVQGLNKSMRSNSRYYAKLLIRHGHSFELEVADTPERVSQLLPEVIRLHKTRAYATEVSRVRHWDHFYRPDRTAFVQEIAPVLAERGEFKVGLLHVDGEVVAGQLWFEKANTIFLYYSGFVPAWAKYGVQLVTTLEVLKNGMHRGINRFELLRGGGQLKERWDTEVRLISHTLCSTNPALAKMIRIASDTQVRLRNRQ